MASQTWIGNSSGASGEPKNNFGAAKYGSLALWSGIAFSFIFTAIIYFLGQRLSVFPKLPDSGVDWYYWRLPAYNTMARVTAWGFYALHQVSLWACIYYAQTRVKRYTAGLHPINMVALGVNVLFTVLHLLQTHVWYGALAEDVSIFSSQGSVILLLVWVLLMENSRRGLFFGKKLPIGKSIIAAAKKYHGYVFSWAIIYTFWYHPMETTFGHLIGFVYTFLLMVQGSLFFTRTHVNKWWMLVQEVTVLFHGATVAYLQAGVTGFWPMFAFGFAAIFIITQMHGLGLSRLVRGILVVAFVAATLAVYSWRGFGKIDEVIRIPIIEYLCVLVLALLIGLGVWVRGKLNARTSAAALTSGR
jgi:hypothetical protein